MATIYNVTVAVLSEIWRAALTRCLPVLLTAFGCAQLHERSELLRTQIGALEVLCSGYNGARRGMQPIEQPLLQAKLDAVDAELRSGLLVRSKQLQSGCVYGIWDLQYGSSSLDLNRGLARAVLRHFLRMQGHYGDGAQNLQASNSIAKSCRELHTSSRRYEILRTLKVLLQTLLGGLSSGCASQVLTWNSHHIDERIKDTSGAVRELQELLALVQGTIKQANDLARDWATHSLFELKEGQVSLQAHQRAASVPYVLHVHLASGGHFGAYFQGNVLMHFTTQVYSFADFKAQCKTSFTVRRKAIAAGRLHSLCI